MSQSRAGSDVATQRVASVSVVAAAAPAAADTALCSVKPGILMPHATAVLVRADLALIGATSVTGFTVTIHRGQTVAGATVYAQTYAVTGAKTVSATVSCNDASYDGTGYTLSIQAVGADGTADATLEAQPLGGSF